MKIKKVSSDGILTTFDCQWKASGQHYHRRLKGRDKADILRQIAEMSHRAAPGSLTWRDGYKHYEKAKQEGGTQITSLVESARSIDYIAKHVGETTAVEATTRKAFGEFLAKRAADSSPQTANKDLRNLRAIARWLRSQGHIEQIPFEHVPALPAKPAKRNPVPLDRLQAYQDALPPHILLPLQFALAVGCRSRAICQLSWPDVLPEIVILHEKRGKERKLLRDPVINAILEKAAGSQGAEYGKERVFLNAKRKPWDQKSLLRSASAVWKAAGLEPVLVHELRHTFGNEAGKKFHADQIRAAMGHDSRVSSQGYVHPDEKTAAEVRAAIYPALLPSLLPLGDISRREETAGDKSRQSRKGLACCPKCGHKFKPDNEKGR